MLEAAPARFGDREAVVLREHRLTYGDLHREAFLMTHPKVAQAFVVGVPDARLGEVAVAFVIPRAGETVTDTEIEEHGRGRLASFKVPRRVFVDDVPRTPGPHGDKVQKTKLREQALQALGLAERGSR